jgi:site-specific DNA-methyltransferase (adenine-specific)
MPTIPSGSIDAIITDLPYGTTQNKWDSVIPLADLWLEIFRVLKSNGVFITTADEPFTSVLITSNLRAFKYKWTWHKINRITGYLDAKKKPLKVCEDVCVFYMKPCIYNPQMTDGEKYSDMKPSTKQTSNYGKHIVKRFTNGKKRYPQNYISIKADERGTVGRIHPTQKPVALYEYLIKTYTNEGETVLDICMGSGTTIEAAERTGRNSIGIEKDEGIFQSAVLRLKSLTPSNNRLHLTGGTVPVQGDLFTPEDLPSEGKLPAPSPRR